ncbi:sialate O-acetylesterase [Paenibacillus rigui]|uniref:Sialate O-acetylesterase domain-containing protein n=1 Tax=Paenibacillus rigui TaxID=554312 RepID=A0A229UUS0_9BACL|nr:sialate O-acetylesterase [Paenibacillus rigui]OXM87120.1 hypothetical protein CF651_05545 [Paenibacillus rigui]
MEPSGMKLFLLIGQSNMAGRGELTAGELTPVPGVWSLAADLTWKAAVDPLHYDKPEIAGVGPGLTFAETIAAQGSQPIGLIPCAVGGTRIERWVGGADLYEAALQRARAALPHGELSGILWAQGESDSDDAECARAYEEQYFSLIRDVREDLGCGTKVPFIAAKLGTFIRESDYPYTRYIQAAVEAAADRFPSYGWVSSDGLEHKGDFLHYDAQSARELGKRFAQRYLSMMSGRS